MQASRELWLTLMSQCVMPSEWRTITRMHACMHLDVAVRHAERVDEDESAEQLAREAGEGACHIREERAAGVTRARTT